MLLLETCEYSFNEVVEVFKLALFQNAVCIDNSGEQAAWFVTRFRTIRSRDVLTRPESVNLLSSPQYLVIVKSIRPNPMDHLRIAKDGLTARGGDPTKYDFWFHDTNGTSGFKHVHAARRDARIPLTFNEGNRQLTMQVPYRILDFLRSMLARLRAYNNGVRHNDLKCSTTMWGPLPRWDVVMQMRNNEHHLELERFFGYSQLLTYDFSLPKDLQCNAKCWHKDATLWEYVSRNLKRLITDRTDVAHIVIPYGFDSPDGPLISTEWMGSEIRCSATSKLLQLPNVRLRGTVVDRSTIRGQNKLAERMGISAPRLDDKMSNMWNVDKGAEALALSIASIRLRRS